MEPMYLFYGIIALVGIAMVGGEIFLIYNNYNPFGSFLRSEEVQKIFQGTSEDAYPFGKPKKIFCA